MATPPRMLLLCGGGTEAFVLMPVTLDKALQAAQEKFQIPKDTHIVRLSCKAADMPWIGEYAGTQDIFMSAPSLHGDVTARTAAELTYGAGSTDNDSYHYACAGKHVVRLDVHAWDKNANLSGVQVGGGGGGAAAPPAATCGGAKKDQPSAPAAPAKAGTSADQSLSCETTAGKTVALAATVSGDLSKGPPAGEYLGTLRIEPTSFKQTFSGRQLGPNEVLTKYAVHNKNTARLVFRPRSVRPRIDMVFPEERSLEVSLSVQDWQITSAYPMTSLLPDGARQRLRWFLKVKPGGGVEDLLTGTEAQGLFVEMLPSAKAGPAENKATDPLIPAWPDVRPATAWCLPQTIFVPHIDRVLAILGLPLESRTSMITAWMPGITRHKNIAYRILGNDQLSATTSLTMIPPPDVLVRILVLFRGVPDSEMKEWEARGLVHAEMGLDWTSVIGWTPNVYNEELFRVFEYGAMEVFD